MVVSATMLAMCAGPLMGISHAAGSTIFVDNATGSSTDADCLAATHATIQSAVGDAASGDTIVVCPSTYDENVSDSGKSLTFLGSQQGVDARAPRSGAETIVDGGGTSAFSLSGTGSTLDGFELTGATNNVDTPAAFLSGVSEGVSHTIFTGDGNGATIIGTKATFSQDLVAAPAGSNPAGFFFASGGGSNSLVANNAFKGNLSDSAVNVADLGPTGDDITVSGNTMDATSGGNFVVVGGTRGLHVTNNTVTGSASDGNSGIFLLGDDSGYTIDHNTITGIGDASAVKLTGGFGYPDNGDGDISNNAIKNNFRGINVFEDSDGTVTAHDNIIVGNTDAGINLGDGAAGPDDATADVNATDNYFGCNGGPNASGCDTTSDSGAGALDTTPYIVLNTSVANASVVAGGTTTFTANLNHDSTGAAITGTVLDNVETATFTFNGGTRSPATAPIVGGAAHTTLTAGSTAGHFTATAKVEHSSSSKPVTVTANTKPAIRINDSSTAEGNSGTHTMKFAVVLNKAAGAGGVSVQYTTADGSAKAGSDYIAKSGTVTIPAGAKTGAIFVVIKGDKVKEASETFTVTIFNPKNGFITDPNATGAIRNDDK
jgi:hypothetical protein